MAKKNADTTKAQHPSVTMKLVKQKKTENLAKFRANTWGNNIKVKSASIFYKNRISRKSGSQNLSKTVNFQDLAVRNTKELNSYLFSTQAEYKEVRLRDLKNQSVENIYKKSYSF